jgi:hypothetical protein
MTDSDKITSNPPAETTNSQRVLPDDTSGTAHAGEIGGGEGNCPLWYGHIIDATFPPM